MGSPIPLTLEPGFTADPDAGTPSYDHTERGVALRGTVLGTFDGSGQSIGTLRAASGIMPSYRPRKTRRLAVAAENAGAAVPAFIEIGPDGDVVVHATGDQVSLDGVVIPMGG